MFNLGTSEIVIILIVALVVLGPQQLPELGKFIGKTLRELRGMSSDVSRALDLDGHNDYDHSAHRGSSFEYGYDTKHDAAIDEFDANAPKPFVYSAPQGTTVAAIDDAAQTATTSVSLTKETSDLAHVADKPFEAHDTDDQTFGAARVYTTPTATNTPVVASASSTTG